MTKIPIITKASFTGDNEILSYIYRLERDLKRLVYDIDEIRENPDNIRVNGVSFRSEIESIRDDLVKNASEIISLRDSINLTLENNYIAKNEISEYAENAVQNIELDGKGITQYFKEISALATRVDNAESDVKIAEDRDAELELRIAEINAYIRTGKLADGVYGIEIGNFYDGDVAPYKVRLSENRLSFYIGNTEVAYFSDNSMMVANVGVLSALNIGDCIVTPDEGITFVCKK